MPIYRYQCTQCGAVEEVFAKVSDEPPTTCSSCGAEGLEKWSVVRHFSCAVEAGMPKDIRVRRMQAPHQHPLLHPLRVLHRPPAMTKSSQILLRFGTLLCIFGTHRLPN